MGNRNRRIRFTETRTYEVVIPAEGVTTLNVVRPHWQPVDTDWFQINILSSVATDDTIATDGPNPLVIPMTPENVRALHYAHAAIQHLESTGNDAPDSRHRTALALTDIEGMRLSSMSPTHKLEDIEAALANQPDTCATCGYPAEEEHGPGGDCLAVCGGTYTPPTPDDITAALQKGAAERQAIEQKHGPIVDDPHAEPMTPEQRQKVMDWYTAVGWGPQTSKPAAIPYTKADLLSIPPRQSAGVYVQEVTPDQVATLGPVTIKPLSILAPELERQLQELEAITSTITVTEQEPIPPALIDSIEHFLSTQMMTPMRLRAAVRYALNHPENPRNIQPSSMPLLTAEEAAELQALINASNGPWSGWLRAAVNRVTSERTRAPVLVLPQNAPTRRVFDYIHKLLEVSQGSAPPDKLHDQARMITDTTGWGAADVQLHFEEGPPVWVNQFQQVPVSVAEEMRPNPQTDCLCPQDPPGWQRINPGCPVHSAGWRRREDARRREVAVKLGLFPEPNSNEEPTPKWKVTHVSMDSVPNENGPIRPLVPNCKIRDTDPRPEGCSCPIDDNKARTLDPDCLIHGDAHQPRTKARIQAVRHDYLPTDRCICKSGKGWMTIDPACVFHGEPDSTDAQEPTKPTFLNTLLKRRGKVDDPLEMLQVVLYHARQDGLIEVPTYSMLAQALVRLETERTLPSLEEAATLQEVITAESNDSGWSPRQRREHRAVAEALLQEAIEALPDEERLALNRVGLAAYRRMLKASAQATSPFRDDVGPDLNGDIIPEAVAKEAMDAFQGTDPYLKRVNLAKSERDALRFARLCVWWPSGSPPSVPAGSDIINRALKVLDALIGETTEATTPAHHLNRDNTVIDVGPIRVIRLPDGTLQAELEDGRRVPVTTLADLAPPLHNYSISATVKEGTVFTGACTCAIDSTTSQITAADPACPVHGTKPIQEDDPPFDPDSDPAPPRERPVFEGTHVPPTDAAEVPAEPSSDSTLSPAQVAAVEASTQVDKVGRRSRKTQPRSGDLIPPRGPATSPLTVVKVNTSVDEDGSRFQAVLSDGSALDVDTNDLPVPGELAHIWIRPDGSRVFWNPLAWRRGQRLLTVEEASDLKAYVAAARSDGYGEDEDVAAMNAAIDRVTQNVRNPSTEEMLDVDAAREEDEERLVRNKIGDQAYERMIVARRRRASTLPEEPTQPGKRRAPTKTQVHDDMLVRIHDVLTHARDNQIIDTTEYNRLIRVLARLPVEGSTITVEEASSIYDVCRAELSQQGWSSSDRHELEDVTQALIHEAEQALAPLPRDTRVSPMTTALSERRVVLESQQMRLREMIGHPYDPSELVSIVESIIETLLVLC